MFDKNKLIASLNAKKHEKDGMAVEAMNQSTINRAIANEIQEIIDEVEADREDDMFGIQDILSGMKTYCELFQGKCENCFFNVTYKDYHQEHVLCAYDMIKHNVKDKGK